MIIGLELLPDQSQQINHLAAGGVLSKDRCASALAANGRALLVSDMNPRSSSCRWNGVGDPVEGITADTVCRFDPGRPPACRRAGLMRIRLVRAAIAAAMGRIDGRYSSSMKRCSDSQTSSNPLFSPQTI